MLVGFTGSTKDDDFHITNLYKVRLRQSGEVGLLAVAAVFQRICSDQPVCQPVGSI